MLIALPMLPVTSFTLVWIKIICFLRDPFFVLRHELHARVD